MAKKKTVQIRHFLKRLWERYEIRLHESELDLIVKQIQNNTSVPIIKQSSRIVIHDVLIREQKVRVAYDKVRKVPITALKLDWVGKDSLLDFLD